MLGDELEVGWAIVMLSGEGGSLKERLGPLGIAFFLDCGPEVNLQWWQARVLVFHQKTTNNR